MIISEKQTKLMEHLRPWCSKCKNYVLVFEFYCCYQTHQIYLTAKCHGDTEYHTVPMDFFTYNHVQQSVAFQPTKKLKALDYKNDN